MAVKGINISLVQGVRAAWPGIAPARPRGSCNAGGQTAQNTQCDSSKAFPGAPWSGLERAWLPGTENFRAGGIGGVNWRL